MFNEGTDTSWYPGLTGNDDAVYDSRHPPSNEQVPESNLNYSSIRLDWVCS